MSYTPGSLSLINDTIGGGFKHWIYVTADASATYLGAGYFSDATNKRMNVGDIVWVLSGTLNTSTSALTEGAETFPVTAGLESLFSGIPAFTSNIVSAVSAGAATIEATKKSVVTDNSGGTANAATGIVATLAEATVIMPVQNTDIAAGTIKLALPYNFKVIGTPQYRVAKPVTTAAKLATATLQVSGVAATGGVISLTSATMTPMGAAVAASAAVTALGVGAAGGTVEFAFSSVTAFIEGDGWFEVTVVNTDLANAIATLIAF